MPRRVIDELITVLGFEAETGAVERAQQRVKALKGTLDSFARGAGIIGAALTGTGFMVGRTILSFDRAMNTLQATFLNAPVDELGRLRDQAQELGRTTSKSATDAANAQVELARAGLDVQQTFQAIPHVLNLAIAGELSMADAAGLVTNQLAAFKLETTEANRVVDVLSKTATSARTTVAELGPAFRQVAPLAADLGMNIEQTAAIIGTLRSGGLIPEQAGTAFRNIIAILQEDPSDKVREGFRSLGLEFEDLRALVSRGEIEEAFRRIGAAGLGTQESLQIFGREAAVGASILAGSIEDVDAFRESLVAAGGTADQMRQIMESGLPGSVDGFKSVLEGLQLEIGDAGFRGVLIQVIDSLRAFLSWMSDAPAPVRTLMGVVLAAGPVLLGLAAAAKAASFVLGGLQVIGGILRFAVNLLSIAWWRNTAAMAASRVASVAHRIATMAGTIATWAMTAATWAWNAALYANPIGIVILGLVALGGAIYAAVRYWDDIKTAVISAWDWMVEKVRWAWPVLKWVLIALGGPIVALIIWWRELRDAVFWVWDQIVDKVMWAWDKIKGPIEKIGGFLGGGFGQVGGKVGGFLGFQEGGIVPGPAGQPRLAMVHGGEMVLPQTVVDMFRGFAAGPQALPAAPPGAATTTTIHGNREVRLDVGGITINAQGADSQEIADNVDAVLRDRMAALVIDLDGAVAR